MTGNDFTTSDAFWAAFGKWAAEILDGSQTPTVRDLNVFKAAFNAGAEYGQL